MFPTVDTEDIVQVTSVNSTNSSLNSDAQGSASDCQVSQVAKQENNRELTVTISVTMLIIEFVVGITLALTTYGALQDTPVKISKHPQAVKFFSSNSVVTDWYKGELSSALDAINTAEVSFVMYYAPWDAECQYVRQEFEQAAKVLQDRVHFSAINCWNPGSECRLQHNKISSWPILMAYTSKGVLYRGPTDAHSMVKFLELIIKPLERISSTEDLVQLFTICDAAVVAFTPLTDTSQYYNIWYNVAIKAREYDPFGEICFGVVLSDDLAVELGVDNTPAARLLLWNGTKDYVPDETNNRKWNESFITKWIIENFSQPVSRIVPLWKKANSFERYIDGSPILILFTPLNALYEQLPVFGLLREVAMEYYNCRNNESHQWTSELIKLQQVQRVLYQQKDYMKYCQQFKFKQPAVKKNQVFFNKGVVSRNNKYPWNNRTQKGQKRVFMNFFSKRRLEITDTEQNSYDSHLSFSLGLLEHCSNKILPAEKSFYENYEQCKSIEDDFTTSYTPEFEINQGNLQATILPFENDPLSPENLIQEDINHFCKIKKFAYKWGPPVLPAKVAKANISLISGLACETNFSMHMLAVDSVKNYHFAESLGIDISNKKDKTAVVILDSKHETQYVLAEEYSAKSIREFIYNYTHRQVKRTLRTHVENAAHTHYYGSNGEIHKNELKPQSFDIINLTTRTFRKVIRTPGMVCSDSLKVIYINYNIT